MRQILPRLHAFTGLLLGRVYCIEDEDGLTLVDAGLALAAPKVLRQLGEAGRVPGDVKRILVTHAHPDHVGGLPALKTATRAQVICTDVEKPYAEGTTPILAKGRKPAKPMSGTPVDRTVQDGDVLPEVFGGLQVVATPGHTLGQAAFWQPERRVLICGDTMMNMLRVTLPFDAYTADMALARRSVAKVARLEPEVVCFGHGPVLTGAAAKITDFARRVG